MMRGATYVADVGNERVRGDRMCFGDTDELSAQACSLWGKTGGRDNPQLWLPLAVHMADTAETARLIWREWLASSVKRAICQQTGLRDTDAETLVVMLAGAHDIGKATPSFQSKVPERAEAVATTGLRVPSRCENHSHAFMGEVLLNRWLVSRGWDERLACGFSVVVGGHHGVYPNDEKTLGQMESRTRIDPNSSMGDEEWSAIQHGLLEWVFVNSGAESLEEVFGGIVFPTKTQVLVTAIVIMADWIASNSDLFPMKERFDGWSECASRAVKAWRSLRLPKRLTVDAPTLSRETLFHARFNNIPKDAHLRPMQSEIVSVAKNMQEPCLIIIEDSMGEGKTEGALLACEILMQKHGASGLAFLLPTQATSNAMFTRIETWLLSLLASQQDASAQDLHLLHGKAELNKDYESLATWQAGWMGDRPRTDDAIIAHQWFGGRKRGLLAPFVVGTVDQLLMAALRTKHVQLRHLGLCGKVVVIDEVHAYDAYMSTYLDRVLYFLGSYGVPVVLLSATLPPARRTDLLNAYKGQFRKGSRRNARLKLPPRLDSGDPCYPLVSYTSSDRKTQVEYQPVESANSAKRVKVCRLNDGDAELLEELRASLVGGGCICVLRNTVSRAQKTYRMLCENLNARIVLAHSRFIAKDRADRDAWLSNILGPKADERPQAFVVVATQVLEQSLDIDLDLLITDVAPVDLLLQRMGRLHRHRRGAGESQRPALLRVPRCVITGVENWDAEVPSFSKGISAVYQPAVLMRTICAIYDRMGSDEYLELPLDIAPLVEKVYGRKIEIPLGWSDVYADFQKKEDALLQEKEERAGEWLLPKLPRENVVGWMRNPVRIGSEMQGRAAVRDSEETIEVAVVQGYGDEMRLLPWIAEQLGVDAGLGTYADTPTDEVARAVALCTVNLPPALSAPYIAEEVIDELWRMSPCMGWRESRWLKDVLPLVVNRNGEVTIACGNKAFHLRYSQEFGLETL